MDPKPKVGARTVSKTQSTQRGTSKRHSANSGGHRARVDRLKTDVVRARGGDVKARQRLENIAGRSAETDRRLQTMLRDGPKLTPSTRYRRAFQVADSPQKQDDKKPSTSPADAPKDPKERMAWAQRRGSDAVNSVVAPTDDQPVVAQTRNVRTALEKAGLPTRANGVEVHVLGDTPDHGTKVARSVAGPASLGQGADVFFHDNLLNRQKRADFSSESLDDALKWTADGAARILDDTTNELARLRKEAGPAQQTRIASMSYGWSPVDSAENLATWAARHGRETNVVKDINADLKAKGQPELDLGTPDGRDRLQKYLTSAISERWSKDSQVDAARTRLAGEVARAREAGFYPLMSAGNEGQTDDVYAKAAKDLGPEGRARLEAEHRSVLAGIPGLKMVGATQVGDPTSSTDDRMASFSSPGADFATAGQDMPVGEGRRRFTDLKAWLLTTANQSEGEKPPPMPPERPTQHKGTSFASPYASGVVALMVSANPKITPQQIDGILGKTVRDDPTTTRDGRGIIDEVAAIRAAKALLED